MRRRKADTKITILAREIGSDGGTIMTERLVTVATFVSPVEGNLAKNRLEVAGIESFLADEATIGQAWILSNALTGIKLQVHEADADEAMAILGGKDSSVSVQAENAPSFADEFDQPSELYETDAEENEPLTNREKNADRAFKGALLGLLLLPLQLYVFWLLLKIFVSGERLGPNQRRRAIVAAVVNLPVMCVFCLWLRAMLSA